MEKKSPASLGFYQPAEWIRHEAVWLGWPSHSELWQENLDAAREEVAALCNYIYDLGRGEKINLVAASDKAAQTVSSFIKNPQGVETHVLPFGDIWLRDTAPIFLKKKGCLQGALASFKFNGWGKKYVLPHDAEFSEALSNKIKTRNKFRLAWILEGGSVEVDGEGSCLTSRQCLLNKNRNSELSQASIEENLRQSLGVSKILWLTEGLINDHTDGHIDTIARFVGPAKVVCMRASDLKDPNAEILKNIEKELSLMTDAMGRKIEVMTIPSPGKILNDEGKLMPASYVNFYISNSSVIVPTYGSEFDEAAVEGLQRIFPDKKVVGSSAKAILSGGGAFHCISQQQPEGDYL